MSQRDRRPTSAHRQVIGDNETILVGADSISIILVMM